MITKSKISIEIKDPEFYKIHCIKAAIFDLDGVVINTAKHHYQAWKRLAGELGFEFPVEANEQLKGISRKESLRLLLQYGGVNVNEAEMESLAEQKNQWYVESLRSITEDDVLPGVRAYLMQIRSRGIKTAIGSASKNARFILARLGMENDFDFIADGFCTDKAKPDPEVFLIAAVHLETPASQCVVFEDSIAGIQAAKSAGMTAIGIGDPKTLEEADRVISGFSELAI